MAAQQPYGFVGWGASMPGGAGGYVIPNGLGGIIVGSNDPHAQEVIQRAKALGVQAGLMIETPYAEQMTPQQYAQRAAEMSKRYGVDFIVPDIEGSMSHGGQGSASWQWSDEAARLLRQYSDLPINLTTEYHQDMNYGAWTGVGANVWAQSYGADPMAQQFDPQAAYDYLISQGVPADRASTVLAPGQTGPGAAVFDLGLLGRSGQNVTFRNPGPREATTTGQAAAPAPARNPFAGQLYARPGVSAWSRAHPVTPPGAPTPQAAPAPVAPPPVVHQAPPPPPPPPSAFMPPPTALQSVLMRRGAGTGFIA